MLEEKDLQAIAQMMNALEARLDKKLDKVEARLDEKLAKAEERIVKNTVLLMDAEFKKNFSYLVEHQQIMMEKLAPSTRVDKLEDEVDVLKSAVRQLNSEVQTLKQAN